MARDFPQSGEDLGIGYFAPRDLRIHHSVALSFSPVVAGSAQVDRNRTTSSQNVARIVGNNPLKACRKWPRAASSKHDLQGRGQESGEGICRFANAS